VLHTFSTDSTAGNPSQTNLDIDNLQMEEEKTSNKTLSDLVKYSMHEALRGLSATAELLVERSYIPLYVRISFQNFNRTFSERHTSLHTVIVDISATNPLIVLK